MAQIRKAMEAEHESEKAYKLSSYYHQRGDKKETEAWLVNAAKLGNPIAAEELVIRAAREKDNPAFILWPAGAADLGNFETALTVASEYAKGGIVPIDHGRACFFVKKATSMSNQRLRDWQRTLKASA